jgi:hypothetical protein
MFATALVDIPIASTGQTMRTGSDRPRAALIAIVILITSIAGIAVVWFYPVPDVAGRYSYAQLEPIRDFLWAFFIFAGVNVIVGNVAGALAGWQLVSARGAAWTTVGGALMGLGAAIYGVGIGGWATIVYYVTNPTAIDPARGSLLLDYVFNDVPRLFGAVIPGGLLVMIGTVCLAIGLWRARTVPRWVPILLASLLVTLFLQTRGTIGLVAELPHLVASMGMAWFIWQRARQPIPAPGSAGPGSTEAGRLIA